MFTPRITSELEIGGRAAMSINCLMNVLIAHEKSQLWSVLLVFKWTSSTGKRWLTRTLLKAAVTGPGDCYDFDFDTVACTETEEHSRSVSPCCDMLEPEGGRFVKTHPTTSEALTRWMPLRQKSEGRSIAWKNCSWMLQEKKNFLNGLSSDSRKSTTTMTM